VPVQAVFREGERLFVYRGNGASPEEVVVTIGKSSETHVQILDGLKEGDRVFLATPAQED